ncbi:hypothetical protein MNBD_ALPHA06-1578 [hydrothermal vent metagenome]|uniref:peptidylprolyl isomerase n=1 Tax=hydrothermal vent metagenome TaxID=652676 RepID=A0A3B0SKE3_9ZZZZ
MIRKFIPILPLFAVSLLFACGATEQVEEQAVPVVDEAGAFDAPVTDEHPKPKIGSVFRPVGAVDVSAMSTPESAPGDWRQVPADQLIVLKTSHGATLIEMAPDFAPGHTARFGALAHEGYFKGLPFHRVIQGFMAQAGQTALVGRPEPTTENLKAEFIYRRPPSLGMTVVGERRTAQAGFIKGFKFASQNPTLAMFPPGTFDGNVAAWQLHCSGAVAAARLGNDINSANAQFYITTSYPDSLDKLYTVWGRVRAGLSNVSQIKKGEPPMPPDLIEQFSLVTDLAANERPQVWVMNTDGTAFSSYLDGMKTDTGSLPDICKIEVPVIVRWP